MKRPRGNIKVCHMKEILHILLDKLEQYDDKEDMREVTFGAVLIIDDDFWDDKDEKNKKRRTKE